MIDLAQCDLEPVSGTLTITSGGYTLTVDFAGDSVCGSDVCDGCVDYTITGGAAPINGTACW